MKPHERAAMRAIVRAAAGQAYLPAAKTQHPDPLPIEEAPRDEAALVARFRLEFEALGGVVHEATSLDALVGVVAGLAARQATPRVLAWSDDAMGLAGLHDRLAAAGLTLVEPQLDQQGEGRAGQIASLNTASIGLTSVDAAIAETGTLVVVSGPGRPRLASLLTPVHVAVVRRQDIVGSLRGLVRARPALVTAGSNFVAITGPSRTADIEHTLSRGVHGPGDVHVILVSDKDKDE